MPQPIRILLVEDNATLRVALRALLRTDALLNVVGDAADGLSAIKLATALSPDVILMDINLEGDIDGIEVTRQTLAAVPPDRRPPAVIGLSASGQYAQQLRDAGAVAFLPKDESTRLIPMIRQMFADRFESIPAIRPPD